MRAAALAALREHTPALSCSCIGHESKPAGTWAYPGRRAGWAGRADLAPPARSLCLSEPQAAEGQAARQSGVRFSARRRGYTESQWWEMDDIKHACRILKRLSHPRTLAVIHPLYRSYLPPTAPSTTTLHHLPALSGPLGVRQPQCSSPCTQTFCPLLPLLLPTFWQCSALH